MTRRNKATKRGSGLRGHSAKRKGSSALSKIVENALGLLDKKVSIGEAIAESAREFDRSPRQVWTSLRQGSAYRFWLTQQNTGTLEEIDFWADKVAEIVLSSSSDQEIDARILALGSKS